MWITYNLKRMQKLKEENDLIRRVHRLFIACSLLVHKVVGGRTKISVSQISVNQFTFNEYSSLALDALTLFQNYIFLFLGNFKGLDTDHRPSTSGKRVNVILEGAAHVLFMCVLDICFFSYFFSFSFTCSVVHVKRKCCENFWGDHSRVRDYKFKTTLLNKNTK